MTFATKGSRSRPGGPPRFAASCRRRWTQEPFASPQAFDVLRPAEPQEGILKVVPIPGIMLGGVDWRIDLGAQQGQEDVLGNLPSWRDGGRDPLAARKHIVKVDRQQAA